MLSEDSPYHLCLYLKKIGKGKIDAIKYARALKKDGKLYEDMSLI